MGIQGWEADLEGSKMAAKLAVLVTFTVLGILSISVSGFKKGGAKRKGVIAANSNERPKLSIGSQVEPNRNDPPASKDTQSRKGKRKGGPIADPGGKGKKEDGRKRSIAGGKKGKGLDDDNPPKKTDQRKRGRKDNTKEGKRNGIFKKEKRSGMPDTKRKLDK